jgi:hypothetical protein
VFSFIKSLLHRRLFDLSVRSLASKVLAGIAALVWLLSASGGLAEDTAIPQNASAAPAPVIFTIGDFPFIRPACWQWVIPSSAMRKVQLAITASDGSPSADVSFFTFGKGQGGSAEANVERWAKQFSAPDGTPAKAVTESRAIGSTTVTFVSAEGSFAAGMTDDSTGPKPGYALRGAIMENDREDVGDIFVKMTGPEQLVLKATPAFDAMIIKACQDVR